MPNHIEPSQLLPKCLTDFLQEESATSLPEYALVGAVVMCGILSLGTIIGAQHQTLQGLTRLNVADKVTEARSAPASTVVQAKEPGRTAATKLPRSFRWTSLILVAGAHVMIVGLAVVVMRRRRRKPLGPPSVSSLDRLAEQSLRILRSLRQHIGGLSEWEMMVETAMCRDVITVRPSARIDEIERALQQSAQGTVVVTQSNGVQVGLITEARVAQSSKSVARELMEPPAITLDAKMPLTAAAQLMLQHNCSVAPVVQGETVRGLVSPVEMSITLQATLQFLREIEMQHRQTLLRAVSPAHGS